MAMSDRVGERSLDKIGRHLKDGPSAWRKPVDFVCEAVRLVCCAQLASLSCSRSGLRVGSSKIRTVDARGGDRLTCLSLRAASAAAVQRPVFQRS